MAISYDPESIDSQLVHLQRVIASTHSSGSNFSRIFIPKLNRGISSFGSNSNSRSPPGVSCDEVFPNLFVGDEGAARNKSYLKSMGITHVVNTAEGSHFTQVDTGHWYYVEAGIKYLGLEIMDVPHAKISVHFHAAADFIDDAIRSGGKVLVHCLMGLSRSATIAIAYLMIKRGLTVEDALKKVRKSRGIRPNDGFLRQLICLQCDLRRRF